MKPVWISHRGYCRDATENTAEAFRAAVAGGFMHLETDLRATADGHLVLCHDPDTGRISEQSLVIAESRREELSRIVLHRGESLLFFSDFLPEFSRYHWIFDIKPDGGMHTLELLLSWWRQPRWSEFFAHRVRFLLWDSAQQAFLLEQQPGAICMARVTECRQAGFSCLLGLPGLSGIRPGVTYALPPRLGRINLMRPAILKRYWRRGGRVLAYLPRNDDDTRLALQAGADEILTNHRIIE